MRWGDPVRGCLLRFVLVGVVLAVAAAVFLYFGPLAGPGFVAPQPSPEEAREAALDAPPLKAGAAKVEITPEGPCYLAGFGANRRSSGVYDPLYARALVLERGPERIGIVALDLLGLSLADSRRLKEEQRALPPASTLVCATHTHAGPDTLGFWGPAPYLTGVDGAYVRSVCTRAARALDAAAASLRRAVLRIASAEVPDGIATNRRQDGHDRTVRVLSLEEASGGTTIATLVHFAMHAEALWSANRLVSADWPGVLLARIEERRGGIGLFVQGPLGGMVTLKRRADGEDDLACAERVGRAVADTALAALEAERATDARPRLAARRARVLIPCKNRIFNLLWLLGKIERPGAGMHLETEVSVLAVGGAMMVGVPGELLPRPGRAVADAAARHAMPFVTSLADDEIGYLLSSDQWPEPRYRYERRWSPGPEAADLVVARSIELIRSLYDR